MVGHKALSLLLNIYAVAGACCVAECQGKRVLTEQGDQDRLHIGEWKLPLWLCRTHTLHLGRLAHTRRRTHYVDKGR